MKSLAEQYPKEQARCRELLKAYREIPTGFIGANLIEIVLQEADQAAISGDLPDMIVAFEKMKDCE